MVKRIKEYYQKQETLLIKKINYTFSGMLG
jgi:hypothetical protein